MDRARLPAPAKFRCPRYVALARLSPTRCSRKCGLQYSDVDLDRLHHRVRRPFGLGSIGDHLAGNGGYTRVRIDLSQRSGEPPSRSACQ